MTRAEKRAREVAAIAERYHFTTEINIEYEPAVYYDHEPDRIMLAGRTYVHLHLVEGDIPSLFAVRLSAGWVTYDSTPESRSTTKWIGGRIRIPFDRPRSRTKYRYERTFLQRLSIYEYKIRKD